MDRRKRYLILISVFLLSCTAGETALEGVWESSKGKTEENLPVTSNRYGEVEHQTGAMSYRFSGNQTTFSPKGSLNGEEKWLKFKIVSRTADEIVINISGHGIKETVKFGVDGDCLGKPIDGYGFTEYFCQSQQP